MIRVPKHQYKTVKWKENWVISYIERFIECKENSFEIKYLKKVYVLFIMLVFRHKKMWKMWILLTGGC